MKREDFTLKDVNSILEIYKTEISRKTMIGQAIQNLFSKKDAEDILKDIQAGNSTSYRLGSRWYFASRLILKQNTSCDVFFSLYIKEVLNDDMKEAEQLFHKKIKEYFQHKKKDPSD